MACNKKTYSKIMQSVRRKHPSYGLQRRKKIVSAVIYSRKRRKR